MSDELICLRFDKFQKMAVEQELHRYNLVENENYLIRDTGFLIEVQCDPRSLDILKYSGIPLRR